MDLGPVPIELQGLTQIEERRNAYCSSTANNESLHQTRWTTADNESLHQTRWTKGLLRPLYQYASRC
jgi:hypothetical protein